MMTEQQIADINLGLIELGCAFGEIGEKLKAREKRFYSNQSHKANASEEHIEKRWEKRRKEALKRHSMEVAHRQRNLN